ncbi:MAG TPA: hypothetical protein VM689_24525 [Aliidongia sp.]|nr:hypothetical protein [Aliidongia sp.]
MNDMFKGGVFITAEQIRTAPAEILRWLHDVGDYGPAPESSFVLEQNGLLTSEDNLAICSGLEIKELLHRLSGDYLACQVLFQLGCEFYDPHTGEHRPYVLRMADFLDHTDVSDNLQLHKCLDGINAALRGLRKDREVTIFRPEGHDGIRVHQVTQHRIYQLWRRLAHVPSPSPKTITHLG